MTNSIYVSDLHLKAIMAVLIKTHDNIIDRKIKHATVFCSFKVFEHKTGVFLFKLVKKKYFAFQFQFFPVFNFSVFRYSSRLLRSPENN